jgi:hypothetical protein
MQFNTDNVMGDWRNIICLVADDEDLNLHFLQAEELADTIVQEKPEMNIEKYILMPTARYQLQAEQDIPTSHAI